MIVFCPNCGTQTTGVAGAKSTCVACASIFEVPFDAPRRESAAAAPPPKPTRPAPPAPSLSAPAAPLFTAARGRPRATRTNSMAIASLVAGIVCCVPVASPLVAIGAGILGLKQIDAAPQIEGGKGLAIAGIVLGAGSALIHVFWLIGTVNKSW